jgi:hydroxymethylbilane synthase
MKRLGDCEIVPIRGNVPTRIAKLAGGDLDGVVLAAAGLRRLGIEHPNWIDLPVDSFLPAPGQGALAVQVRTDSEAAICAALVDDEPSRRCVAAERAFLSEIKAGCHTPTGALATVRGARLSLRACLFTEDHTRCVEGQEPGNDPQSVGARLAHRLIRELGT